MHRTAVFLMALPSLGVSRGPTQECPTICTASVYVETVAGSDWSVTVSDVLGAGSAKEFCVTTCIACSCSYSYTFDGGVLNQNRYKYVIDGTWTRGRGDVEGGPAVGETDCDEINVDVFEGFDANESGGWTRGVLIQLYCTCPG